MVGKSVVLLLVAAVAALGWSKHRDRIREQDRLAVIASSLVGRDVEVHCPSIVKKLVNTSGEAGTVKFDAQGRPAKYTDLAPETCDALRHADKMDFACLDTSTCGYKEFQVGWAIHTLAHESFHMRGIAEEGMTECFAMQTTGEVAVRLGIPSGRAAQLQQWIWTKGYPNEPEEYRTTGCGNGGRLDLHPGSAVFP